jgi:energy-coupling factor transporter ATP-binding protein EcfA2
VDIAEINRIRTQFQAGQWPQFLEMTQISGLRGWTGQTVVFQFPVTAVVGENGTGKSTVLKASASCYENTNPKKNYYPSAFFVNTHWDRIQGVELNYRVKRGTQTPNVRIAKPTSRWSFSDARPTRSVYFFDISRVVPIDASAGYAKIAKLAAAEISTTEIEPDFRDRLSHVLGRAYSSARFAMSDVDTKRAPGSDLHSSLHFE